MPVVKDLIRIAVADDELGILQLFCNHINTLEKCKVVLQAENGLELINALKENPSVDLVILDVMMPLLDGYETAKIIRQTYPHIRVLFYSVCKTELALHLMAASGGHGLIRKGAGGDEAKKAIKSVMKGKYYFPALTEEIEINGAPLKINGNGFANIGQVEINFMRHCASEMAYKEIAGELNISERQLEYLRDTIFKKMEVKSRTGLVLKALESGLILRPPANEIPG